MLISFFKQLNLKKKKIIIIILKLTLWDVRFGGPEKDQNQIGLKHVRHLCVVEFYT